MHRHTLRALFHRPNRHCLIYPLWLFFLFNVFFVKQLTIRDVYDDYHQLDVVQRVDMSTLKDTDVKTILLWNPWYGDFGFTLDDVSSFR